MPCSIPGRALVQKVDGSVICHTSQGSLFENVAPDLEK